MDIISQLNKFTKEFNLYAKKFMLGYKNHSVLYKSMNYGLMNGGKRIRPFVICEFSKQLKISKKNYMRLAIATELVHSYSLIHDDLPAMDDDDFRRGKLTTHKKFTEGIAILAGNSLLTLAFEILTEPSTHKSVSVRLKLIEELSKLTGYRGLAGGQADDLMVSENPKALTKKQIIKIHVDKTAKLFEYCLVSTLFLKQRFNSSTIEDVRKFGRNFGMIFQATDDLLDFHDSGASKNKLDGPNILQHMTCDNVRIYCERLADECTENSVYFSDSRNKLNKLIYGIIDRKI